MTDSPLTIIDTHQHLWDRSRLPYRWTKSIPTLDRSFLPEDYRAEIAAIERGKVIAAVHVEADVDEPHAADETRWVLSIAEDPAQPTVAVVAGCRPESDRGFDAILDEFGSHPRVRGVRRILHTQPDELSRQPGFRANLAKLARHDLSFDLVMLARQLPLAIELVRSLPDVRFILDHCGVPDVKGRALDPWRAYMSELGKCENVVACKVSGIVAYGDLGNWTDPDLKPFVDHVAASFGHDRLMFGSDWPVCRLGASLARWARTADALTRHWSADDRAKMFGANAKRVYRLKGLSPLLT